MIGDPPSRSDDLAAFVERGQAAQRAVNFEIASAELRKLGIDLTRLPGEYRVNFHNGTESTAQIAETIEAALDLGRARPWPRNGDRAGRSRTQ
jgi:hypothetical protein